MGNIQTTFREQISNVSIAQCEPGAQIAFLQGRFYSVLLHTA